MLILQFDGLFREAPQNMDLKEGAGVMCYGWVILRKKTVIARGHGSYLRGKHASSNVAEYLALIEGLEALLDMGAENQEIMICGDAKSIIDQMEGHASVSAASIRPLYRRACKLFARFPCAYWNWTPRRENREADALTRRALHHLRANPHQYEAALHALDAGRPSSRLTSLLDLRIYQTA